MKYVSGHSFRRNTSMDIIGRMVLVTTAGVLVFMGFYATSYVAADILQIDQKAAAYAAFIVAAPVVVLINFIRGLLYDD